MKHEPSRFLSNTDSAGNFVGTDAVLAIRNHPNGDEPLVEGNWRVLENGADLGTELLAGMIGLALPHATSRNEADFFAPASRANDTFRPAPRHHEFEAVIGVREVDNGFLQGLWFLGSHGVPHKPNSIKTAPLSQVYYCQKWESLFVLCELRRFLIVVIPD